MIRIAIIGFGKIARDSHVAAIEADPRFELVAVSTRSGDPGIGVPWFADPASLYTGMAGRLDAVAICTPPAVRHAIARQALEAGLAVLLEKPPAATLGEIDDLAALAHRLNGSLFAAWHSQHAAAVAPATTLLRDAVVDSLSITWREDVRKWHPGQDWVWEPSGFGVFDPGINALSIATAILPAPLFVSEARLQTPTNRQAPIAAEIAFAGEAHSAVFDWRHGDDEQWTIAIETRAGRRLELLEGGARLLVDGAEHALASHGEYPSLYARFAELVEKGRSEVDREPLRIVADAFLRASRQTVAPFEWSDREAAA